MKKLIIASGNNHKIEEVSTMLRQAKIGMEALSIHECVDAFNPIESGKTFVDNALIKARAARDLTRSCVLADDSGLEVDALGGAPGVISARYAGEPCDDQANNEKLLREMQGVADEKRGARFVCVLAFIDESGHEHTFEGFVEGQIMHEPRGNLGFGYDPLFFVSPLNKCMAELEMDEKNKISHRYEALSQLIDYLSRD